MSNSKSRNYYHRMQYAKMLMEHNARSPNITPEQHEFLKDLAKYRHILHANPEQYFYNTKMTAKIDMFFANMHSAAFCEKLDLPISDEILKIFSELQMNKNMQYENFNQAIEDFSINKEVMNELIEYYLKGIDKQKGTSYCPTGSLRDQNINPIEKTMQKLINSHRVVEPYQNKIQQELDKFSIDERKITYMEDINKQPGFYSRNGTMILSWDGYKKSDKPLSDYKNIVIATLPDDMAEIPYNMFKNCVDLEHINIPDSVLSIDNGAFSNCRNLKDIQLPNNLITINDAVFTNCKSLTHIEIPDSVIHVGNYALSQCDNLKSVKLPEYLDTLHQGVLFSCQNLEHMNTPKHLVTIDKDALALCRSLNNFNISDNVEVIGNTNKAILDKNYIEKDRISVDKLFSDISKPIDDKSKEKAPEYKKTHNMKL